MTARRRRRLWAAALLAAAVAVVAMYRDRALRRSRDDFVDRYGQ